MSIWIESIIIFEIEQSQIEMRLLLPLILLNVV